MTSDPTVILVGLAAIALGLFVLKQVADVIMRLILAIAGAALLYAFIIYFDVDLGPLSSMLEGIWLQLRSLFQGLISNVL